MTDTAISVDDAEEYTQACAQVQAGSWRQIMLAERLGVPAALGLSLRDWVEDRLGGYVRMAIPERREAARELASEGLTEREIADVLGTSPATAHRDIAPDPEPASFEAGGDEAQPKEQPIPSPDPEPASFEAGGDEAPELEDELLPGVSAGGVTGDADQDRWMAENEPHELEDIAVRDGVVEKEIKPAHVGRNSGDNEWYTPAEYVKAATNVMGAIDLDPASSDAANSIVGAERFYTEADDGLVQPWTGRVWMNPPYAQPLVDRFCARLARAFAADEVTQACVLVNNATETGWFQTVAAEASAMCFPRGRIKFWHPDKEATPLQGQAVIYMGENTAQFKAEFLPFGFVVML